MLVRNLLLVNMLIIIRYGRLICGMVLEETVLWLDFEIVIEDIFEMI